MDFFALQDKARKQTRVLVFLFIVAVMAIAFTTNLIFFIAAKMQTTMPMTLANWLAQPYWKIITVATFGLILSASLWRSWQLKTKPDAIAKMVNATSVSLSSPSKQEKILVNVIEEMSIASGMAIPKIYIMREEQGVNAFVSGLEPSSVILVVTQGLLDTLNRQELQGVIAHEYSHIFHGDMRLNVRLIGVLAGILIIGQLGGLLLRSGSYGTRRYHRSSSSKSSGNAGAVMLVGVGLFAIGYIGLFFGRLIKAAISRQREFLADASAVQYTRDKEGIASALFKISTHQNHSLLNSSKAEEMSHMCFAESVKSSFMNLLATHPPIEERIKAINPGFNRRAAIQQSNSQAESKTSQTSQTQASPTGSSFSQIDDSLSGFNEFEVTPSIQSSVNSSSEPAHIISTIQTTGIINSIGEVSPHQVYIVKKLLNSIPHHLIELAQAKDQTNSCYWLIIGLLIVNQTKQSEQKNSKNAPTIRFDDLSEVEFKKLIDELLVLNFQQQHCLLDLALARVEQQPQKDNQTFVATLARLVSGKKETTLSEFMIYASAIKKALISKVKTTTIARFKLIQNEIILFFSLLYQQSDLTPEEKQNQFERQIKLFGFKLNNPLSLNKTQKSFDIDLLRNALNKIAQLNPLLKGEFIQACLEIINNDGTVTQDEYELLRLLTAYLDTPLPISEN